MNQNSAEHFQISEQYLHKYLQNTSNNTDFPERQHEKLQRLVHNHIENTHLQIAIPFQDSDEENPFGDDVGGNVVSFNDMDPQKLGTGGKAGGDKPFQQTQV